MEEKITSLLRSIGLGRNEATVYIDLISRKSASAREIAGRTKLHRANTYEALKKLIDKGFVEKVTQEEMKIYRAHHPRIINDYLNQRILEVNEILPTLKTLTLNEPEVKDEVSIAKGTLAVRALFEKMKETNKSIDIYGVPSHFREIIGEGYFREFNKDCSRKKVLLRAVLNNKDLVLLEELNSVKHTEAKYLNVADQSLAMVCILDETVALVILAQNPTVIKILNRELARTYKHHFEILWKHAKILYE